VEEPVLPYGLFTSAANSVYAPGAFLRPTDLSPKLRGLTPEASAATLRRGLPLGAATPVGKALGGTGLGGRQFPMEHTLLSLRGAVAFIGRVPGEYPGASAAASGSTWRRGTRSVGRLRIAFVRSLRFRKPRIFTGVDPG